MFKIVDSEIELAQHQIDAIEFIKSHKNSLVNYDTGTGKTYIAIQSAFDLFNNYEYNKAIIVCTKSSILSFYSDLEGTNYKSKDILEIKSNNDIKGIYKDNKRIILIQFETLLSLRLSDLNKAFKDFKSVLIIDEVHRVKTVGKKKAAQTANCLKIIKTVHNKLVGLTATTITSKPEDFYRICDYIQPRILGGYKWFKKNFCICQKGSRYNRKYHKYVEFEKIVQYKDLNKLLEFTKSIMIQFFPEMDYRFHLLTKSINPDSETWDRYCELAESTHGNDNHSSIGPKLRRLVNKSKTKRFLLRKCIEQCIDRGMIIFCQFRKADMFDYIQDILTKEGVESKVINGSTKDRKSIMEWMRKDPKNKALVISLAGGQSLNLHFTNNLIFFTIPQGIGQFAQTKGRIGRMFSKFKHYNFYFPVVKNTVDDYDYQRFLSQKEIIKYTANDNYIPDSKFVKFDERKLKRLRDKHLWMK